LEGVLGKGGVDVGGARLIPSNVVVPDFESVRTEINGRIRTTFLRGSRRRKVQVGYIVWISNSVKQVPVLARAAG
jgi:hypothetical protein